MSVEASRWAWKQRIADPTAKLLLLKLADQANDDGVCWPSRRSLADDCGIGLSTISRKTAELADAGLLTIEQRERGDGSHTSNLYRLAISDYPPSQIEKGAFSAVTTHEPSFEPNGLRANALKPPRTPSQDLVAYFVDRSREANAAVPKRVIGQVAKLVGEMVSEGISPEQVRAGIDLMLERRMHPSTLPSAVHSAGLRPPAAAYVDPDEINAPPFLKPGQRF